MRYSFTLHNPDGKRLIGFDNAHGVPSQGSHFQKSNVAHDHWHRTVGDAGRPYRFITADQLLTDFEAEVERVLRERGVSPIVVKIADRPERGSQ